MDSGCFSHGKKLLQNYQNIATTNDSQVDIKNQNRLRFQIFQDLPGSFDLSSLSKQMISKSISSTGCRKMCRKLHVAEPCCLLWHQTCMLNFDAESVWWWFKNMFLELRGRPTGTASVHLTNCARTSTVAATMPGTLKASIPHHQCTSTEELQVLPSRDESKTHVDEQEMLHTNSINPHSLSLSHKLYPKTIRPK